MYMRQNGDQILDVMTKAMMLNTKDPTNRRYLRAISVQMKGIFKLWFNPMVVMRSKEYQSDATYGEFRMNTIVLNKTINSLPMNPPPVPGLDLKHSKQLNLHLLFDWEIFKNLNL